MLYTPCGWEELGHHVDIMSHVSLIGSQKGIQITLASSQQAARLLQHMSAGSARTVARCADVGGRTRIAATSLYIIVHWDPWETTCEPQHGVMRWYDVALRPLRKEVIRTCCKSWQDTHISGHAQQAFGGSCCLAFPWYTLTHREVHYVSFFLTGLWWLGEWKKLLFRLWKFR